MAFNPISIGDEKADFPTQHDTDQSTVSSIRGAGGGVVAADAFEDPLLLHRKTPLRAAPRRCLQKFYFDFSWKVEFPTEPKTPLLYYPQVYKDLLDNPAATDIMSSEFDAMSAGVLQRIPLAYYPLQPQAVHEMQRIAQQTANSIAALQAEARATGQLDRMTWSPEEVNPLLEAADAELLDSNLDRNVLLQRDLPSLTLLQRPLYTDMGMLSQEQRHAARLDRIVPAELRALTQGATSAAGLPGSPMSPASPQLPAGTAAASADSVFDTPAAREARAHEWQREVHMSFRHARAIDAQFDAFLAEMLRGKLGLDAHRTEHMTLGRELWRVLFVRTTQAQQRDVWHALCRFSSSYGEEGTDGGVHRSEARGLVYAESSADHASQCTASANRASATSPTSIVTHTNTETSATAGHACHNAHSAHARSEAVALTDDSLGAEALLMRTLMSLSLPHFDSIWLPLLRRYCAAVAEYAASLPHGPSGRKLRLHFSGVELDPRYAGAFHPDLVVGKAIQRSGKELGENRVPIPVYPIEVMPVFPSGFTQAARMGPTVAQSEEGNLDFLAEAAEAVRHVVLPGALISAAAASSASPHVLINDSNLLIADAPTSAELAAGTRPLQSQSSPVDAKPDNGVFCGKTISYHTHKENTFEQLLLDETNTSSYIMRVMRNNGGANSSTLSGYGGGLGENVCYCVYDRIGVRADFVKATRARCPPDSRYVLLYEDEQEKASATTTTTGVATSSTATVTPTATAAAGAAAGATATEQDGLIGHKRLREGDENVFDETGHIHGHDMEGAIADDLP